MPNTPEEKDELQRSIRDLAFEFACSIGVIWVVDKLPFLKLKDHYQRRYDEFIKKDKNAI